MIQELLIGVVDLQNPAVQSGVAPALAALVVVALVWRSRWWALAPLAGLLTVVALALGFSFEPLTSVRKLTLCLLAMAVIAVLLDAARCHWTATLRWLLGLAVGAACLWIGQRVLQQKEGAALVLPMVGYIALALMLWWAPSDTVPPVERDATIAVLGLTVGALGFLGASLSLALVGIAAGATTGVTVLARIVRPAAGEGAHFVGAAALTLAALAGAAATLTGELVPLALLPLPFIVMASRGTWWHDKPAGLRALGRGLIATIPAALAVVIAAFHWGASAPT